MARGPRHQKHPTEIVGCAVQVAKITADKITEKLAQPNGKVRSEKIGETVRATKLAVEERSLIARKPTASWWQ